MNSKDMRIDRSWTLFLDRDGVINRRIPGDYVRNRDQFEFLPGVTEALASLSGYFGRIIVVSNQQGIGKGIMTASDLEEIHRLMRDEISRCGGRIDRVYYSPEVEKEDAVMRKPAPGMALAAKKDFPEIDFNRSVMVGDSLSDIKFGRELKMVTVLATDDPVKIREAEELADQWYPDLRSFSASLNESLTR